MKKFLSRMIKSEEGATMVEYGIIIVLVALVAAAGLTSLGNGLSGMFTSIANSVSNATVGNLP